GRGGGRTGRRPAGLRPPRPPPGGGSPRGRRGGRASGCRDRPLSARTSHSSPSWCPPLPVLTECSVYASIGLVPMPTPGHPDSADAVVVGGGTLGGWCAYFLRRSGLDRVVLLEKGTLGQGPTSRPPAPVRLHAG